ncbi:MAG TPA: flippase-like domain-containing protein [Thermomicrobiales bacterium]|nr:flippase-like domain-containing protein [Thermomicrobiales bacterium]
MRSDTTSRSLPGGGRASTDQPVDGDGTRGAPSRGTEPALVTVDPQIAESNEQVPESIGRRLREPRTLISFGFALVIIVFVFTQLDISPGRVWDNLKQANLGLLLAAAFFYYLSLFVRGMRWKSMLGRVDIDDAHGYPMPGPFGMFHIIFLSWFANCVVPARLGDAYRSYLLKQKTKASFSTSLGTILAERLLDLVVLVLVVLASGIVVFGTKVPHRAEQAFLFGAAIVVIGVVGAVVLWLGRDRFERWLPDRFAQHYQRLHAGIFQVLRRPFPYGLIGVGLWMCDGIRVMLIALALGTHLTIAEATLVALLSALATAIPVTPAGLGVVELFMIWILSQVGVLVPDTQAAIALLDRFVTYYSLILIGIPVYILSLRSFVAPTGEARLTNAEAEPVPVTRPPSVSSRAD